MMHNQTKQPAPKPSMCNKILCNKSKSRVYVFIHKFLSKSYKPSVEVKTFAFQTANTSAEHKPSLICLPVLITYYH